VIICVPRCRACRVSALWERLYVVSGSMAESDSRCWIGRLKCRSTARLIPDDPAFAHVLISQATYNLGADAVGPHPGHCRSIWGRLAGGFAARRERLGRGPPVEAQCPNLWRCGTRGYYTCTPEHARFGRLTNVFLAHGIW
jgi:hypothetical protein